MELDCFHVSCFDGTAAFVISLLDRRDYLVGHRICPEGLSAECYEGGWVNPERIRLLTKRTSEFGSLSSLKIREFCWGIAFEELLDGWDF